MLSHIKYWIYLGSKHSSSYVWPRKVIFLYFFSGLDQFFRFRMDLKTRCTITCKQSWISLAIVKVFTFIVIVISLYMNTVSALVVFGCSVFRWWMSSCFSRIASSCLNSDVKSCSYLLVQIFILWDFSQVELYFIDGILSRFIIQVFRTYIFFCILCKSIFFTVKYLAVSWLSELFAELPINWDILGYRAS